MMGSYQIPTPNSQKPWSASRVCFVPKGACQGLVFVFLALAALHILCCSPGGAQRTVFAPVLQYINNTYSFVSSVQGDDGGRSCNYSEGQWVRAPGHARRYNGTLCNVRDSHNCIRNGRPDTAYLDWRWQPDGCPLPPFDAKAFLSAVRGKNVAFVGDSMARNQAQSLVCLLSASYPYRLLHRDPDPSRNWLYAFPSHAVTVSFYWAPFLVRATGNAQDRNIRYSHVRLDEPDERWAADAETMDVVVLAASHWLLNGAIYYNGSNNVIGTHNAPELNHTSIGYARPLRTAYRKAVERLIVSSGGSRARTVVLATFSPSHFQGSPINNPTACSKTEPYKKGDKELEWGIYKEVRDIVYDEAKTAKEKMAAGDGDGHNHAVRIEVLDVTTLASMRPDGHPNVYWQRDPFAKGVLVSDCIHFCLPGPVDTFNEVLLQILLKKRR